LTLTVVFFVWRMPKPDGARVSRVARKYPAYVENDHSREVRPGVAVGSPAGRTSRRARATVLRGAPGLLFGRR